MYTFCIIMICIASILLILAVLVQSPKSGMAANFGAANQTMGVRQTTDFLEKFTWAMIAAIVLFSVLAATSSSSTAKVAKKDVLDEVTYQNEAAEDDQTGDGVMTLTPADIENVKDLNLATDVTTPEPTAEPVVDENVKVDVVDVTAEPTEPTEPTEPAGE